MTGTLVASTPKASLNALAFQGIMAYASFSQIRDMLQRQFGDEYALIFANPEENPSNGIIDWYSPAQGAPRPLAGCTEEEQKEALKKIQAMGQEIASYADTLIRSPDPLKVTRGSILKLALLYPGGPCIYLVGNQPVLTCWGFEAGTSGVEPHSITCLVGAARKPPKPVAPPLPAAPARAPMTWGWLWWLLPLFAFILLLFLLFTSFGQTPALSGKTLLHGPQLPFLPQKDGARLASLRDEVAALERKARDRAAMCQPAPAPAAPSRTEQLAIPPAAADASFLEGLWLCETGLGSARTNEPIKVEFAFDRAGKGRGVTYEKNGRCVGAASAVMASGELHIALGAQECGRGGRSYQPVRIICANASGSATQCHGVNADGTTWNASFTRIR